MHNLQQLRDRLKEINHPSHELATFLLAHSNDPDYLTGVLRSMIEAVDADMKAKNEFHSRMFAAMKRDG
jgi:hypothetical protein